MDLKSFTLSAQAIIHPFVRVGKFDTRSRSYTYTTFFPSSRDPNLLLSPPSRISNSRRLEGRKPGVRFPRPQRHSANAYSPPPQTSRPPDNPQLAFQTPPSLPPILKSTSDSENSENFLPGMNEKNGEESRREKER